MGQIIKSLASVGLPVVYGRITRFLMKFCTVVRASKCKIEFVLGQNPLIPFPILPPFLRATAVPAGTAESAY